MTAPSPARRRILEILADCRWHPVDEVLDQAALAVPPGRAWRTGEYDRTRRHQGPRTRGTDATTIAAGRRSIARRALRDLTGAGGRRPVLVERDGRRIRLTDLGAATIAASTARSRLG